LRAIRESEARNSEPYANSACGLQGGPEAIRPPKMVRAVAAGRPTKRQGDANTRLRAPAEADAPPVPTEITMRRFGDRTTTRHITPSVTQFCAFVTTQHGSAARLTAAFWKIQIGNDATCSQGGGRDLLAGRPRSSQLFFLGCLEHDTKAHYLRYWVTSIYR
jgi:hypothetical protein